MKQHLTKHLIKLSVKCSSVKNV